MSVIAKQSTARTVTVGPILDSDGVAVTGAVVGDLKISKNGAAPAALNGSATLTHRNTGHYSLALTASDTDTVGSVEIVIDKTTDAMPTKTITIVEEVIYDALFAASATGALPATLVQGGINTTSGTITTLDALDTAQDTQHSTTQSAISTAQGNITDILVDTGTTLPAAIAAIDAGSGSGAYGATVTVTDGTNPLQNATVRVTLNGNTAAAGTTDASGNATFSLDAATYTVAITLAGYTFTPTTRTVTAEQTGTLISADLEMSAVSITPSTAGYCTVYVSNVLDEDGDAEAATVYIRATGRGTAADGIALDTKERSVTANGSGYAEFTQCVRLAKYQIKRGSGPWFDITVPDAATYEVPSFTGVDE